MSEIVEHNEGIGPVQGVALKIVELFEQRGLFDAPRFASRLPAVSQLSDYAYRKLTSSAPPENDSHTLLRSVINIILVRYEARVSDSYIDAFIKTSEKIVANFHEANSAKDANCLPLEEFTEQVFFITSTILESERFSAVLLKLMEIISERYDDSEKVLSVLASTLKTLLEKVALEVFNKAYRGISPKEKPSRRVPGSGLIKPLGAADVAETPPTGGSVLIPMALEELEDLDLEDDDGSESSDFDNEGSSHGTSREHIAAIVARIDDPGLGMNVRRWTASLCDPIKIKFPDVPGEKEFACAAEGLLILFAMHLNTVENFARANKTSDNYFYVLLDDTKTPFRNRFIPYIYRQMARFLTALKEELGSVELDLTPEDLTEKALLCFAILAQDERISLSQSIAYGGGNIFGEEMAKVPEDPKAKKGNTDKENAQRGQELFEKHLSALRPALRYMRKKVLEITLNIVYELLRSDSALQAACARAENLSLEKALENAFAKCSADGFEASGMSVVEVGSVAEEPGNGLTTLGRHIEEVRILDESLPGGPISVEIYLAKGHERKGGRRTVVAQPTDDGKRAADDSFAGIHQRKSQRWQRPATIGAGIVVLVLAALLGGEKIVDFLRGSSRQNVGALIKNGDAEPDAGIGVIKVETTVPEPVAAEGNGDDGKQAQFAAEVAKWFTGNVRTIPVYPGESVVEAKKRIKAEFFHKKQAEGVKCRGLYFLDEDGSMRFFQKCVSNPGNSVKLIEDGDPDVSYCEVLTSQGDLLLFVCPFLLEKPEARTEVESDCVQL